MTLIDQILATSNLREMVAQRVALSSRGKRWWGCCPFHTEATPSFMVEDDHFHCFGCGAHGDVIDWVERTEGVDKREAIRRLAGEVVGPVEPPTPKVDPAWPQSSLAHRFKGLALRHHNALETIGRLQVALAGDAEIVDPAWDQLAEAYRECDDTEHQLRTLLDQPGLVPWEVWFEQYDRAVRNGQTKPVPFAELFAHTMRPRVVDMQASRGRITDDSLEWQRELFDPCPEARALGEALARGTFADGTPLPSRNP